MEKQAYLLTDYTNGNAKKRNAKFAQQRLKEMPATSTMWSEAQFQKISEDIDKQLQTMAVLRKHLPAVYQEHVRLLWSETTWRLSVERPALANELKWITDTLITHIYGDIGFRPNITVVCKPNHWATSGQLIRHPKKVVIALPTAEEADEFIDAFTHGEP